MIPKNPSLRKAVTAALPHITPESRTLARQVDERNAEGMTEAEWEAGAARLLAAIFREES